MSGTSGGSGPVTTGTRTVTSNPRQLSDGNGLNGGPGTILGQGTSDNIGFYSTSGPGVPQPSGGALAAVVRGVGAGMVMTFASTQSPSSVVTLTTAEKSITVQSGSAAVLTPASGDLFIVNKPTAQAGIGIGNIRYSAAGVVGLTVSNFSAGTLTPTTSQVYGIVGIRGLDTLTTVLTPAAVAASTTAEQVFTVSGVRTGTVVAVNKPTSQAGLDIVNARVSANNQLAITFVNVTAGVLTPTAAETYTVFQTAGIDAGSNMLVLQANAGTISAVVTATTAEATITSANVAATDFVVGVQKPTLQAGLGIVGGRVSGATTVAIAIGNVTAGTLTPTASEDYVITLMRPQPVGPVAVYAPPLTPVSISANTTAEQTFTVTGLVAGSPALVNKPSFQSGIGIVGARVSAANTLAINYCNATANTLTPAAETYMVANFQIPIDTTAGNAMIQPANQAGAAAARLVNGLQAALGPSGLNLVAGS